MTKPRKRPPRKPSTALGRAIAAALARDGVQPPPDSDPPRRHKYGALPTVVDGVRFDSRGEARRYGELRTLERAGVIAGLRLQPRFPLIVNGSHVADYVADFSYLQDGAEVVEDFKSPATATPSYRLKAKLVRALYGIRVVEVMAPLAYTRAGRAV